MPNSGVALAVSKVTREKNKIFMNSGAGTSVLTALYHFGTKRGEHWMWALPGAVTATLVWFPATLAFGWYVTRVADYSMFYGSFAAGIATLVWLYLTSFSALLGAELNGVLFLARQERISRESVSDRL